MFRFLHAKDSGSKLGIRLCLLCLGVILTIIYPRPAAAQLTVATPDADAAIAADIATTEANDAMLAALIVLQIENENLDAAMIAQQSQIEENDLAETAQGNEDAGDD